MKIDTRTAAVYILLKVIQEQKSFHPSLIASMAPKFESRDLAFISHLCFGVLRYYHRLEGLLQQLLQRPLKPKDQDIVLLMMIGLYQIHYTDTPPYAIVHSTVSATTSLRKPWARGLVNGILRQGLRLFEIIPSHPEKVSLVMQTAHPRWLVESLQKAWPSEWEKIIAANLQHPPLVLRVNLAKISRQEYLELLNNANIRASNVDFCPAGVSLLEATEITTLPGFHEGLFSVQDGAAQLAANLLELQANQRVLDACAAPGGKMAHILETNQDLHLVAVEKDIHRIPLIEATLQRLGQHATLHCADATCTESWWDGQLFDRILLDAPCSATGVIRRHPDIKLHRRPEDILLLAQQQILLLQRLWPLLKPNGILVYATCSILPQENGDQIALFLEQHPDAKELPIMEAWGSQQQYGRQLLPGQDMDGFYYARLIKRV